MSDVPPTPSGAPIPNGPPNHTGPTGPDESEVARKDREWGEKGARASAGTPGAPIGGGGHTAGTGAAGADQPYRTPKHLRTSSGPRFSGRGVLAVFGILGLLLTLGIMAFLAVKVLDGVSGSDDAIPGADLPEVDLPDAGTDTAPPGGAEIDPGTATDAADAAKCAAERSILEIGVQAYELLEGEPPSSVDDLVAARLVVAPEGGFAHEISADGTLAGTGECSDT